MLVAHDDADVAWIRVAGALDCATAPELGRTLDDAQGRAALAVLDLSELSFIDCAGMHTIVEASSRAGGPAAGSCSSAATPPPTACSR